MDLIFFFANTTTIITTTTTTTLMGFDTIEINLVVDKAQYILQGPTLKTFRMGWVGEKLGLKRNSSKLELEACAHLSID